MLFRSAQDREHREIKFKFTWLRFCLLFLSLSLFPILRLVCACVSPKPTRYSPHNAVSTRKKKERLYQPQVSNWVNNCLCLGIYGLFGVCVLSISGCSALAFCLPEIIDCHLSRSAPSLYCWMYGRNELRIKCIIKCRAVCRAPCRINALPRPHRVPTVDDWLLHVYLHIVSRALYKCFWRQWRNPSVGPKMCTKTNLLVWCVIDKRLMLEWLR